jgi:hypothetical protein
MGNKGGGFSVGVMGGGKGPFGMPFVFISRFSLDLFWIPRPTSWISMLGYRVCLFGLGGAGRGVLSHIIIGRGESNGE